MEILINNQLAWKIKVTFSGKILPKEYITPDIRNIDPGWASELFNRTIERLEFYIPTGHKLILSGMEKYNFFVEAVQDLGKRGRGKTKIQAFWFCGKVSGKEIVELWRITNGIIQRDQKPYGQEWQGKPSRGWKSGMSGTVISNIVRV